MPLVITPNDEDLRRIMAKLGPKLMAEPVKKFLTGADEAITAQLRGDVPSMSGRLRGNLTNWVERVEWPQKGFTGFSSGRGDTFYGHILDVGTYKTPSHNIRPRRYRKAAIKAQMSKIKGLLNQMARDIRKIWDAR